MPMRLPAGKRLAVNIGVDFDAMCALSGHLATPSPSILSRGDFDAQVGTPRLLRLFARRGIATTWCTPGHTFARWRDTFDYAHHKHPGGILTHTMHGLVSGRALAIMVLERFIVHMKQHDDVWFATLSDIYDCWRDD